MRHYMVEARGKDFADIERGFTSAAAAVRYLKEVDKRHGGFDWLTIKYKFGSTKNRMQVFYADDSSYELYDGVDIPVVLMDYINKVIGRVRFSVALQRLNQKMEPYLAQGYGKEMAVWMACGSDESEAREMVTKMEAARR